MTTGSAISSGLRAVARHKTIVSLFYSCNLLMAAAIAAPMYTAMRDHIGNSMVGDSLLQGLNAPWLSEFNFQYAEFVRGFAVTVAYAGVLFLALNTVLSGGAFEVFARGEAAGLHAFGRGIGKYFGRFARIAVIASVLYFALFWLFNEPLNNGIQRLFRHTVNAFWPFYLNLARVAILIFCVVVVNMLVDYARADVVRDEHSSALAAFGHAAGFVFANFGRVLAIYVAIGVLTVVTVLVYSVFAHYFPESSVFTVLIWFLVAQALLWLRWMFRLASWAAATSYYGIGAGSIPEVTYPEVPRTVHGSGQIDPATS